MSRRARLEAIVEIDARLNAGIAWLMVVFVLGVVAGSLRSGDLLWAGFAAVVAGLALVPVLAYRSPVTMLPWEVLVLATLPLIGRVFATVALTSRLATYLAVAAVALMVALELSLFTTVRMTTGFAVLFVVVATMATAGTWAVARWTADVVLGTQFLLVPGVPESVIENRLMWEFVWSTTAGLLAGVIFEWYFRRRSGAETRVPTDIGGS